MRVLMIAPPGAGKGTQGAVIAAHFGIPHIATGDLLRDHVARQTDLGRAVKERLDRGELVPDEIVLDMVREAFIAAKEAGGGYVLDGIPRNMAHARAALEHRSDDTEEVIRRRLALYHEVTHPIVAWYGERGILVSVDAMRPAEQVGREILTALAVMRPLVD